MNQHIYVNGPTNVVRLENKEINKVIYVFFDFHTSSDFQTKCDDIRSQDVARFLVQTFDDLKFKSGKTYDFMVERGPLIPYFMESNRKGRYLDQVMGLFNRTFNINLNTNKVQQSDKLPNVNLHWTDVRDYVLNFTMDMQYNQIPQAVQNLRYNFNILNINQFSDAIKIVNSQIVFLYKVIYETKDLNNPIITKYMFSMEEKILSKFTLAEYDEITKKIVYKLLKSYKNKNIQKKILYIINNELHDIFLEFFKYINESLEKLEELKKKLEVIGNNGLYDVLLQQKDGTYNYGIDFNEFDSYISLYLDIKNKIFEFTIGKIGLFLMDLFLLRRFLDKDYITNAITYTGAGHSVNYIRLLIKYFDFDITNCSYIKDNDINSAIEKIKNSTKKEDLNELFFTPVILQCSDLGSFPKLFE